MKKLQTNEEIIDELLGIAKDLVTLFQSYELAVPKSTLKRLIEITKTFQKINEKKQHEQTVTTQAKN
jgi:uncharacterized ubiquitin-like protein YukD